MAIRIVYINLLFNLSLLKDKQTQSVSAISRYCLLLYIVHILESIFLFIEVQLVFYVICVNVLMTMEVVLLSLYNSFASHTETIHDSLYLSPFNLS